MGIDIKGEASDIVGEDEMFPDVLVEQIPIQIHYNLGRMISGLDKEKEGILRNFLEHLDQFITQESINLFEFHHQYLLALEKLKVNSNSIPKGPLKDSLDGGNEAWILCKAFFPRVIITLFDGESSESLREKIMQTIAGLLRIETLVSNDTLRQTARGITKNNIQQKEPSLEPAL